jgi:Domain of unknown function (DUF4336)
MGESGLYAPIQALKRVDANLWIVDGPIERMAVPFGPGMPFPTRMTIARLRDGMLWCHSPVAADEALFGAVDALGPVAHLVSPNKLHYAHLAAWKRRYPRAVAWASPGVRERAASQRKVIAFDADLADAPPPAWSADIDQLRFRGSRVLEEIVFFHRASDTLIVADLIENFEPARLTPGMRWLARIGGVLDPDGKAPLDLRMTWFGRKAIARECFERIMAWHPRRVILAHGRWYPADADAELRRAFRWVV